MKKNSSPNYTEQRRLKGVIARQKRGPENKPR